MPRLRTLVITAGALLLAGGLAAVATADGSDDLAVGDARPVSAIATERPTPTPTDHPTPEATPTSAPAPVAVHGSRTETFLPVSPRTETFAALDAGTVTLEIGDVLLLGDVQPRPGWRGETDSAAGEVEVSFRTGSQRVDWKAELEDGQVRVRVRDRRVEDRRDDNGDDDDDR
jgi:hypothetical protein